MEAGGGKRGIGRGKEGDWGAGGAVGGWGGHGRIGEVLRAWGAKEGIGGQGGSLVGLGRMWGNGGIGGDGGVMGVIEAGGSEGQWGWSMALRNKGVLGGPH